MLFAAGEMKAINQRSKSCQAAEEQSGKSGQSFLKQQKAAWFCKFSSILEPFLNV